MEGPILQEILDGLDSGDPGARKMAVFKLQSNIGDPSFTEAFVLKQGARQLRYLIMETSGNTLAYSLTSFSRILEVDHGWDAVDQALIQRIMDLVVNQPLVNILRGAMSILVHIVSYPSSSSQTRPNQDSFGFDALKPAIVETPEFLETLVNRLVSADHALCANALRLINALIRDAVTHDLNADWPKFIKKLQDLGVIEVVYGLIQGDAVQDFSQPLLEFQNLMKVMLRKWRETPVDFARADHRKALKGILTSNVFKLSAQRDSNGQTVSLEEEASMRLGLDKTMPTQEFTHVGYLGMMDLMNFARKAEIELQQQLLEQTSMPTEQRCPIAKASLLITQILVDHFEIGKAAVQDSRFKLTFEADLDLDLVYQPLLLQWSALHIAGLQAFFRLWSITAAEADDLLKISELVRLLVTTVAKGMGRTCKIDTFRKEVAQYALADLRRLQMDTIKSTYQDKWTEHFDQIREELEYEAMQFIREQRIRCLLAGAWFPRRSQGTKDEVLGICPQSKAFRFARLASNRRFLLYADFDEKLSEDPQLEPSASRIDLGGITSVTSDVASGKSPTSISTTTGTSPHQELVTATTRITISGHLKSFQTSASEGAGDLPKISGNAGTAKQLPLLVLNPPTQTCASEWLDGLLMLLNQQPITKETSKLVDLMCDYGLKIRLLNIQYDEPVQETKTDFSKLDRTGLDDPYFYEDFGD